MHSQRVAGSGLEIETGIARYADFPCVRIDVENAVFVALGDFVRQRLAAIRVAGINLADQCAVCRVLGHIKRAIFSDRRTVLARVFLVHVVDVDRNLTCTAFFWIAVVPDPDRQFVARRSLVIKTGVILDADPTRIRVDSENVAFIASDDLVCQRLAAVRVGALDLAQLAAAVRILGHREGCVVERRRLIHVAEIDGDRGRVAQVQRAVVPDGDAEGVAGLGLEVEDGAAAHGDLTGVRVDGEGSAAIAAADGGKTAALISPKVQAVSALLGDSRFSQTSTIGQKRELGCLELPNGDAWPVRFCLTGSRSGAVTPNAVSSRVTG